MKKFFYKQKQNAFCFLTAMLVLVASAVFADDDVAVVDSDVVVSDDAVVNNDVVVDGDVGEVAADNNIVANDDVVANENIASDEIVDGDNNVAASEDNVIDETSYDETNTVASQPAQSTSNRLDGIAAVVGSEIILMSEVEALTYMRLAAMGINPEHASALEEGHRESLENLINDKVVLVRAMTDSLIHVRNDEIESMLNNHINMILRQNNITLEQFEMHLRMQQGTTLARFRADARRAIREQLYKQKLQQRIFFDTRISRREVEQFFAEYADSLPTVGESFELFKLSLALTPSEAVRQAAHDQAVAIHRRIAGGEDFSEVARELGDPSGGDFGFVEMGSTTEIVFENRVFGLPVGRVSAPFETRFGFHIVIVDERRDRRVRLRQILVRVEPSEDDRNATLATLDSLREAITSRHDFEVAARELSSDQATRIRGGSMGWLTQFEMTPAMRELVNSLEVGQISGVVTEDNALTIYMLNARVDERRLTLENDYALIADQAREIHAQKQLLESVRRWRDRVFIDIRI